MEGLTNMYVEALTYEMDEDVLGRVSIMRRIT